MNRKRNRLFVIGLDGGTWKVLKPLMEEGRIPHLKRLCERGASGVLKSITPPLTAPVWASFQTGVNPGKHGVFDFIKYIPEDRKISFVNSRSLGMSTIWQLLADAGKKVISINTPLTYPVSKVNGAMISGMLTPCISSEMIYPHDLYDEFIKHVPSYKILAPTIEAKTKTLKEFIDLLIDVERQRFKAINIFREKDWDFFVAHIQSSDILQHAYWHLLDRNSESFNEDSYKEICRFYTAIDEEIGKVVNEFPPDCYTLIISDHGFTRAKKKFHLNTWLMQKGYLSLNKNLVVAFLNFLKKVGLYNESKAFVKKIIFRIFNNLQMRGAKNLSKMLMNQISFNESIFYSLGWTLYGNIHCDLVKEKKRAVAD